MSSEKIRKSGVNQGKLGNRALRARFRDFLGKMRKMRAAGARKIGKYAPQAREKIGKLRANRKNRAAGARKKGKSAPQARAKKKKKARHRLEKNRKKRAAGARKKNREKRCEK